MPIPVPFRSKRPVLTEWQRLRITRETVATYFNGNPLNIGILLGATSRGLTDIDLDCREAVVLAERFLPATPCLFGRESTGASHRLYFADPSMPTSHFEDPEKGADGEKSMLVEYRSEGAQTILPPSVHPSGERVMFVCDGFDPAAVDGGHLLRRTRPLLAIACLLGRHWPDAGARHRAALGAAGLLLGRRIPWRTSCSS